MHASRRSSRPLAALALLAAAPLSCAQPLAPDNYRGEVIFRAQGIVESASSSDSWRELRPVIAFKTYTDLRLVDSISVRPRDASGISGDFELELYDVPPDDTFIDFEGHPEWGKVAFGMIAAVPQDHPERLDHLHIDWANGSCASDPSCPCGATGNTRTLDYQYGNDPAAHYHELLCCPDPSSVSDACEVASAEGDPEIKNKPALPVAAVVQDFCVFYIDRDAPAGSAFARYLFHSDAGLKAGYHLLKVSQHVESAEIEPEYTYEVVGPDNVALKFQRDVLPWGVNL